MWWLEHSTPNGEVLVAQRAADEADPIDGNFQVVNEPNEPWSLALERDLQEELRVNVGSAHPFGSWYRKKGDFAYVIHLVHAPVSVRPSITMSVHQAVRWVNPTVLSELSWAGQASGK